MIAITQKTPAAEGLDFDPLDATSWAVRRSGFDEVFGVLSFFDFTDKGPSAFLKIQQLVPGSVAWLAEALVAVLNHGFDQLKLSKVSVRVEQTQLSLIAALDDFGFVEKSRSEGGKKIRYVAQRWDYIAALAQNLMLEHIEDRAWSFGFDNGRRRAGLCSYTDKKITVSKYLSLVHSIDDVQQTILHEIAHALCGPKEGHGKKWLATAKRIGYRNETYTGEEIAKAYAPYQGLCPNGHSHYRYQKPKRLYSCHICNKGFDKRYMIDWMARS